MSDSFGKPMKQDRDEEKWSIRAEVRRVAGLTIFIIVVTLLAVLVVLAIHAKGEESPGGQDKYSLKSPSGIAFSDFRGYEDWPTVSSAHQDDILKVIVANPKMIAAFKAGVPGDGKTFPEGSKIVKLQWKQKKSAEAQFAVDVPDYFTQAFVMEKDSKKFPKTGGWGYAVFNYDAKSGTFSADAKSLSDCGNACHTVVKTKDYIFHPFEMR